MGVPDIGKDPPLLRIVLAWYVPVLRSLHSKHKQELDTDRWITQPLTEPLFIVVKCFQNWMGNVSHSFCRNTRCKAVENQTWNTFLTWAQGTELSRFFAVHFLVKYVCWMIIFNAKLMVISCIFIQVSLWSRLWYCSSKWGSVTQTFVKANVQNTCTCSTWTYLHIQKNIKVWIDLPVGGLECIMLASSGLMTS